MVGTSAWSGLLVCEQEACTPQTIDNSELGIYVFIYIYISGSLIDITISLPYLFLYVYMYISLGVYPGLDGDTVVTCLDGYSPADFIISCQSSGSTPQHTHSRASRAILSGNVRTTRVTIRVTRAIRVITW